MFGRRLTDYKLNAYILNSEERFFKEKSLKKAGPEHNSG